MIPSHTDHEVAVLAQKAPNFVGLVVVVDAEAPGVGRGINAADRAQALLLNEQGVIVSGIDQTTLRAAARRALVSPAVS